MLGLLLHAMKWLQAKSVVYNQSASTLKSITASIIQGSGIEPAAYVVNASDLKAVTSGNQLCKFADDTYIVIQPATSTSGRPR